MTGRQFYPGDARGISSFRERTCPVAKSLGLWKLTGLIAVRKALSVYGGVDSSFVIWGVQVSSDGLVHKLACRYAHES
ncbi:hypothetical protein Plhal304r1_c043g0123921 [Plasmopara halstedii]